VLRYSEPRCLFCTLAIAGFSEGEGLIPSLWLGIFYHQLVQRASPAEREGGTCNSGGSQTWLTQQPDAHGDGPGGVGQTRPQEVGHARYAWRELEQSD
jgi:hypothetical protein